MGVTLYSEGAAKEVTGSKHILEIDDRRLLIDCGAFQGRRSEADEKNRSGVSDPTSVDAMVLTHAHYDHCGMTPLLVKHGYRGDVYCTPATRDLAVLIMEDSARIQQRDADYLARKAKKRGETFNWKPLYLPEDVEEAAQQFVSVSYRREFSPMDCVRAQFYDAGHILGSSTVYCTASDSAGRTLRIGFTGDLGRFGTAIIRDPQPLPALDYLVLESTYGDRLHGPSVDAIGRLEEVVNRTVSRGGKVIIPAFAIERTQEIVYYLHLLAIQKRIPEVPIWIDSPMAISATGIFEAHPECYDRETYDAFLANETNPFGFEDLHLSRTVEQSKQLNAMTEPAVIISASGMCEAGRIQHHLIHTISDSRNTILVVGYMAAHTLGRRIVQGDKEVRIHGDWFPVRAEVTEIDAFSAHADYSEIDAWLKTVDTSELRGIFLVHGEGDAQAHLTDYLEQQGYPRPVAIEYGARYEL